jgi:hypothetical protein
MPKANTRPFLSHSSRRTGSLAVYILKVLAKVQHRLIGDRVLQVEATLPSREPQTLQESSNAQQQFHTHHHLLLDQRNQLRRHLIHPESQS